MDVDAVLDGQICLVRVGKDTLGTETARLFGSIIVARTWRAATRRARIPNACATLVRATSTSACARKRCSPRSAR